MKNKKIKADWEQIIETVFAKAAIDKEYSDRKINSRWIIQLIGSKIIPEALNREIMRVNYTVVERIKYIQSKVKLPKITDKHKKEIGELVRDAFLVDNLFIKSIKVIEPRVGLINVHAYPKRFVPVIDAIIFNYFKIDKQLSLPVNSAQDVHIKSLAAIKKYLKETTKEEVQALIKRFSEMEIEGPTIEEYFKFFDGYYPKSSPAPDLDALFDKYADSERTSPDGWKPALSRTAFKELFKELNK